MCMPSLVICDGAGPPTNPLHRPAAVYRTFSDVAADVRQVWTNALRFNPPGNTFHDLALLFQTKFEEEWVLLEKR